MANIFSNAFDNLGMWLGARIAPYINDAMGRSYSILSSYYKGDHRPQLKISTNKDGTPLNDNITQNFVGLVIDRSISRLFRGGVNFELPEGADEQQEWLDRVWDLNKKEIILYQYGLHGAVHGTTYFKICPDELADPYTGKLYPRLIPIDPEVIRIKTDPQDMNEIEEYIIEYSVVENNKTVSYREITKHNEDYVSWLVEHYEQRGSAQWQLVDSVKWPYEFPPIIHQKNLPSLKSCYGDSEIDDIINVQDKQNFTTSNTGKIIKFQAHPTPIISGISANEVKEVDVAVGKMVILPNADAKAYNLEMSSDLASSRAFALDLRQSIFDVSREVDISSIGDKLGTLTNFGLHVLYSDALDKNDTKRQLYGDALKELNRRLLVIGGWTMEATNPGDVVWGDAMITNVLEEMQVDQLALGMKVIDLETVTKRYQSRYGVDYETVQANIQGEAQEANANNANIGAMILKNFSKGGGVPTGKDNVNGEKPNTDSEKPAR